MILKEQIEKTRVAMDNARKGLGAVTDSLRAFRVLIGLAPTEDRRGILLRAEVVEHYSNAIARLNEARAHLALAHHATLRLVECIASEVGEARVDELLQQILHDAQKESN